MDNVLNHSLAFHCWLRFQVRERRQQAQWNK